MALESINIPFAAPIQIRLVVPSDAPAISKVLHDSFLEFESLYTPQAFKATTPDPRDVFMRMQEGPLWIAISGEEVLGTAAAVVKDESLYMRGMAVLPGARKLNIGTRLLTEIEGYAAEQGCNRIFLSTTPFLHAAIWFYEKSGFRRVPGSEHDLFGTPLFTMEKYLSQ
jgi:GNAT superfamily N-acetyltransferase